MRRMTLLACAGLTALLSSCGSSQIPLDATEQQWIDQTARALDATVYLQHDRETFRAGRGRARLHLGVEGISCQQDTAQLLQLAERLAREAHAIVRYNCIYDSAVVNFSTDQSTGPNSYHTICSQQVLVSLTTVGQTRMSRTWQY
jgi:hypothetical protein